MKKFKNIHEHINFFSNTTLT